MNMTQIGKFDMLKIVNTFDATLIRLYGVNMRDAAVSRQDALNFYSEFGCAEKAAEIWGERRGLPRAHP